MAFLRFADLPAFRNPWTEFERIRQGLDELSRVYRNKEGRTDRANVYPPLNVYEEVDRLLISAEVPGVKPESLDLSIEGDTLTIQGKRTPIQPEEQEEGANFSYHRREIQSGSFNRALTLPIRVAPENISARINNGILLITLMKASPAIPRQIKVNVE